LLALDQGLQDRAAGPGAIDRQGQEALFAKFAATEQETAQETASPAGSSRRLPAELASRLDALWSKDTSDATLIRVMARLGKGAAGERAAQLATDRKADPELRLAMLH